MNFVLFTPKYLVIYLVLFNTYHNGSKFIKVHTILIRALLKFYLFFPRHQDGDIKDPVKRVEDLENQIQVRILFNCHFEIGLGVQFWVFCHIRGYKIGIDKAITTTTTVAIQNHFNSNFAKWMVAIFEVPRNTLI